MKRRALLYEDSESYPRHVYLDALNAPEILALLESDETIREKFDYIIKRILTQPNIYYEGYQKIEGYENLGEMRLFPNGRNIRFYCKEVSRGDGHFCVVVAILLPKKQSEKIDKKIHSIIKPLKNYEYEFE